ncbi:16064_t:CDS:2, partial [Gigaspora rosea]
ILNEREFITEVVPSNSVFGPCPGYICKCGEVQNEITTNLAGPGFKFTFIYQYNKKQSNYIVELKSALQLIYPTKYEIDNWEFQAWKAMLKYVGCSNFEFWSWSTTPNSNNSSLSILYNLGFVIPTPSYSTNTFWSSFYKSLNINECGVDGRQWVLSIIANDFNYEVIRENLDVSNDLICAARKHSHIYSPGELVTEKL